MRVRNESQHRQGADVGSKRRENVLQSEDVCDSLDGRGQGEDADDVGAE